MLSRFPRRADAVAFLAAVASALVLGTFAVVGSLSHVGRAFPGFVVWDDLVVVALGRPTWTGVVADVPYRSRVVRVDDAAVARRADVQRVLDAAPAGAVHRYAFEGPSGATTREVAAMTLGRGDWLATMGAYVVNGIAFLLSGLAAFWLKPESPQARGVLAFGFVWGMTLLLATDLFTTSRLVPLYFLAEAAAPAAILHLASVFPTPRPRAARWVPWLYVAALAIGLTQVWAFTRSYPLLLAVNNAVYLAMAAAGALALGAIGHAAIRAASALARRRARVVLAGAVAAFGLPLPALLAFFLVGEPVSFSLLTLTGFLFPVAIGYAVARHDLFEADRVVKQTLVWATLTAVVSLAYGGAVLGGERVAAGLHLHQHPLFPVVFVLLALATIVPLRERVQRALDRLFARGRVSYKDAIARASERMALLLDRDAIVRQVEDLARDTLFLAPFAVWEDGGAGLVRADGAARIPADDAGLATLAALARPLSLDEVAESPRLRAARPALGALFRALAAVLVVPLVRERRLVGVLAVGGTGSGRPLSADDVDVLRTLADATAVALGTARAVEQLQAARARLAQSERLAAIGELSAAVAHGIRNPLAGIRLAAQLGLENVGGDGSVRESLDDVLTEVDKLEAQARGILDFARPFEPHLEPVALDDAVASVLATLGARMRAAGVDAVVDVAPSLPRVAADRAHLGQVLHELAGNALDMMPAGGRLTVAAAANGHGRVRLTLADTGPGIPPDLRQRIFQLFMTTKPTGTGVGLAVARKIIERHGGTLTLTPADGRGACFAIDLPVA